MAKTRQELNQYKRERNQLIKAEERAAIRYDMEKQYNERLKKAAIQKSRTGEKQMRECIEQARLRREMFRKGEL